jgi:DNA helicase-2/ATP-dependent DNA helicase PcrA
MEHHVPSSFNMPKPDLNVRKLKPIGGNAALGTANLFDNKLLLVT